MVNAMNETNRISDKMRAKILSESPTWGFKHLSKFTFLRTYAWQKEQLPNIYSAGETGTESWGDSCLRIMDTVKARGIEKGVRKPDLFWDMMAYFLFTFKWSPSGRGVRMMGNPYITERSGDPLFNCGFKSTKNLADDPAAAFRWCFIMLSLGVGVGYDTCGSRLIVEPTILPEPFIVEDSREGWADAFGMVYRAFAGQGPLHMTLDVSNVRGKGEPVRGLGGVASGPAPLVEGVAKAIKYHMGLIGQMTTSEYIVDMMDNQAVRIMQGGTRRSAQIALAETDDIPFADYKTPEVVNECEYPEGMNPLSWRYASNHSYINPSRADNKRIAECCTHNGEPGALSLELAQSHGRLIDPPEYKDVCAIGCNPCVEMALHDGELCNVSETNPSACNSLDEFIFAAVCSSVYAKIVTTYESWSEETQKIQSANRRIGVGVTGVTQAIEKHGYETIIGWLGKAYAVVYEHDYITSKQMDIPQSIKLTTVKPSGTISLVMGTTPGCHFDHAPFYIRRVRVRDSSPLLAPLLTAGFDVERDAVTPRTMVIAFPVKSGVKVGKADVSIFTKADLAANLQRYWSDNMVSVTIDFSDEEAKHVEMILNDYLGSRLKSVSFLRRDDHGYAQPPYETISEEMYEMMIAKISDPVYDALSVPHSADDKYCDGEACMMPQ